MNEKPYYSNAQRRCLTTSATTIIVGVMIIAMGWGQGWYWLVTWGGAASSKVWTIGVFVALAAGLGETTRPAPIKWFAPAMVAIAFVLSAWSLLAVYDLVPFPQMVDPTTAPGEVPGLMAPTTAAVGILNSGVLLALHTRKSGIVLIAAQALALLIPFAVLASHLLGSGGLGRFHPGVAMAYPTIALSTYLTLGGFMNALHFVAAKNEIGGREHGAQRS